MQNSTQQQWQQHVPLSTVLVLNNVSAWELKRCVVRAIDADVLLHYCHTHSVLADTFSMLVTLSRVLQSETIEKLLERNFLQKGYSFCRPANTVKTLTTNYQQCSNSIRRYFFFLRDSSSVFTGCVIRPKSSYSRDKSNPVSSPWRRLFIIAVVVLSVDSFNNRLDRSGRIHDKHVLVLRLKPQWTSIFRNTSLTWIYPTISLTSSDLITQQ